MPKTMEELVEYLYSIGFATPDTIVPCSPAEVDEIRRVQGVDLPPQYEQFLLTMGKRAGDLLRGTDFFYPGVIRYFDEVRQFLVENNITQLVRPGSVILGMHQGYQLYWMEPGDPSGPVHWYTEGDDAPKQTWPTLLDCLVFEAEEQKRVRERYKVFDNATGEWVDREQS